jgi:hypothetical protein
MSSVIKSFNEDFSTLIEAGFIAVKQGSEQHAKQLFHAAQILRPDHSAPVLGFGYIALNSLNLEMARHLFSSVLEKEPQNALAKVLLGFSYLSAKFVDASQKQKGTLSSFIKLGNVDELSASGEKLIKEALEYSSESSVQFLGKSALELSKKISEFDATPLKS